MKQSQEMVNIISKNIINKNNNPFQIKLSQRKDVDYELFLSNMNATLKEIILIENDEIDNISESSYENPPLFTYPSEHSSDYDISEFEL